MNFKQLRNEIIGVTIGFLIAGAILFALGFSFFDILNGFMIGGITAIIFRLYNWYTHK